MSGHSTELARLQHELAVTRNELSRLQAALDGAFDAVLITDSSGQVDYVNSAFGALFGHTLDSLRKSGLDSIHSDSAAARSIWAAIQRLEQWSGKVQLRTQAGRDFPADLHAAPIPSKDLKMGGMLLCVKDLTALKTMERQLLQAQKLQSIGQLASGIAHELNTPTQYVGDNLRFMDEATADIFQLLEAYEKLLSSARAAGVDADRISAVESAIEDADVEYLREEVPKAIQQALEGTQRVTTIVQAMKEFSHPGTGQKQAIDLSHAIRSTITVATNRWKYAAKMEVDFDPDLPAVPCLAGEVNQTVLNLIVNAADAIVEAIPEGSTELGLIKVTTKHNAPWAEIRIQDSGPGIPKEIQDRVFDPFFTTKKVGEGSGQGLAISYVAIVEKHGGTLTFESEEGQGTTFIIRLPLSPSEQSAAAA
ncbi:MAG: PAS domain S-box protein [Candidatus Eisenbacteria sp.]|nr:PAS domain S-box protein [Candidatus Eisenbacteria bacterium]